MAYVNVLDLNGNIPKAVVRRLARVQLVLEDYDRASSNDFIGKVEVSIAPLIGKAPQVRFRALQPKDAKGAAALEAARKKKANLRPGLLSQLFVSPAVHKPLHELLQPRLELAPVAGLPRGGGDGGSL